MVITNLQLKIKEKLWAYLNGKISFKRFQKWYSPIAWEIMCDENAPENELIGHLETRFAEFTSGDRSESEMMQLLRIELENVTIATIAKEPEVTTHSAFPILSLRIQTSDQEGVNALIQTECQSELCVAY